MEIKIPTEEELKKAARENQLYGCCSTKWKIGEVNGSDIIINVTNDPDDRLD